MYCDKSRYITNRDIVRLYKPGTHLAWQWQVGKPAWAVTNSKNMGRRLGLAFKPSMREQLGHDIQTSRLGASRQVSLVERLIHGD